MNTIETIKILARKGVNKNVIAKKLFPNYTPVFLTSAADYDVIEQMGFYSKNLSKSELLEIELDEFAGIFINELADNAVLNPKDTPFLIKLNEKCGDKTIHEFLTEKLVEELDYSNYLYESREHNFNVIRMNLYQMKNFIIYFVKKYIEEEQFVNNIDFFENIADHQLRMIMDIKSEKEIQKAIELGNLFVIVPYTISHNGEQSVAELFNDVPDLDNYNENYYAQEISDIAYINAQELNHNIITDYNVNVFGTSILINSVSDKPFNCIFVNMNNDLNLLPNIEQIVNEIAEKDLEFNFVV